MLQKQRSGQRHNIANAPTVGVADKEHELLPELNWSRNLTVFESSSIPMTKTVEILTPSRRLRIWSSICLFLCSLFNEDVLAVQDRGLRIYLRFLPLRTLILAPVNLSWVESQISSSLDWFASYKSM